MGDLLDEEQLLETLPELDGPIPIRAVHGIDGFEGTPSLVSLSDIHGYYDAMASALTAVGAVRDPVVTEDETGALHWAGGDYVLVFNGDLVDRGDHSRRVLKTAFRLKQEAPPGRVRLHLGNHEMAIMLPEVLRWRLTYSGKLTRDARETFIEQVHDGVWTVAFDGYNHTYSHAGSGTSFDPETVNDRLRACATDLRDSVAASGFHSVQADVPEQYDTIFGLDGNGRGPEAGLLWMDFVHMPPDAPPQIVGHTRQQQVVRKGNVICQNTIRSNLQSPGGEAVVVETPDTVTVIGRDQAGDPSVETPEEV